MTDDIVIRAHNLSKKYKLFNSERERLFEWLTLGGVRRSHDHWALRDISFDVRRGEFIGIIGRNGSGKTTLLKILSGVTEPTAGAFEIEGNVVSLLELGTGFNPELTGRQNVLHSSQLLGFEVEYIKSIIYEVETFADIGDYFDQPVKIYSSGMFVRLAMSVFFYMKPDILIVDEALSVGDIFFQQKCMRRMRELREKGVTLLFVSHDMGIVRDLCERAAYLKQGELVYFGPTLVATNYYFQEGSQRDQHLCPVDSPSKFQSKSLLVQKFKDMACWVHQETATSAGKKGKIIGVSVVDVNNMPTMKVQMGGDIKFSVLYQTYTEEPVHVSITLRNRYDQVIHCSGSFAKRIEPLKLSSGSHAFFELQLTCLIEAGRYTFCANLGQATELTNRGVTLDETPWLGPLVIEWDYDEDKAPFFGMFDLPSQGRFIPLEVT